MEGQAFRKGGTDFDFMAVSFQALDLSVGWALGFLLLSLKLFSNSLLYLVILKT